MFSQFFFVGESISFFVFKQKTAYEMRISDWSSDVCSSDLPFPRTRSHAPGRTRRRAHGQAGSGLQAQHRRARIRVRAARLLERHGRYEPNSFDANDDAVACRSEEHTSELQSLMRISYAVFCLKKKQEDTRE